MRKSSQLLGLPVISLEEGVRVGRIKGLILNPATKTLAAVVVEGGRLVREQKFIPFAKVHSMGVNAITISRGQSAQKTASLPEIMQLWKDRTPLIGARVVTESGNILGRVTDYGVDPTTGSLVGIEMASSLWASSLKGRSWLPASTLRTLGKKIIVATDQAQQELTALNDGLEQRARRLTDKLKNYSIQRRGKTRFNKKQGDDASNP